MDEPAVELMREYTGIIWIGDEPGVRFSLIAASANDARIAIDERYGPGHTVTLYSEEDANTIR